MEAVALEALANREPSRLTWGIGELGFAKNRRTEGGPVDHSLPCMQVKGLDGTLRAVWASYACHCTTLAGTDNHICGDWAGYAQDAIQEALPDVTALITIGCGADANPESRMMPMPDGKEEVFSTRLAYAKAHGEALSEEVQRMLKRDAKSLSEVQRVRLSELIYRLTHCRPVRSGGTRRGRGFGCLSCPETPRTLQKGQPIQTELSYPIQAWRFGDELAVVFLASEVVVDYSLRLKSELDAERLWVGAYSNAFPCYIPSERVLAEGGYEGGGAMLYFGPPTRFATGVEQLVIDTVHRLLPEGFIAKS